MTLYIIAAILIVFIILFHSPFRIWVICAENKLSVTVKYLFLKKHIYPQSKNKPQKAKSKEKKESPKKEDAAKPDKKKRKLIPEDNKEKIYFILNILKSSGKMLKTFTKRITIGKITADIDISDEDACDCAVNFGKANIVVFNLISFCNIFFKVKKEHININCVYNKPKSIYNFSFVVKFTPSAGILSVIAFIFTFIVNNIKRRSEMKRSDKKAPAAQ